MKRKYSQKEVDEILKGSAGKFYCNRDDANIFVKVIRPNRVAVIPNLGNIWSWITMGIVVLAVIMVVFVLK